MQTSYDMFIETIVPSDELIVSRTDLQGRITYANETFAAISGYSVDELIGQPHSLVRHPDMPKSIFKELWCTLQKEVMWKGYVKNLRKDGGYYWVYAEVSGVYKDDVLVEYKSLRVPVSHEIKVKMQRLYDEMRENEQHENRVVVYLKKGIVAKVEALARDKGTSGDKIMNELLNDSLF